MTVQVPNRDVLNRMAGGDLRTVRFFEDLAATANGAASSPVVSLGDLTQSGATTGQVPQWSGAGWVPVTISGGGGAASFETVSKNLSAVDATLSYTGGDLTSVVYANGITKTLSYSGGNLVSVVLSGSTPGGIELTKTLTYSGGNLTGITYT